MPENQIDFNHNQITYSVSEVAQSIKRMVEDRFGRLSLRGEISGWKVASSGHVYFRLKDENAVIDAVCWKGTASKLAFKPEDGLEVVAAGKLTTYPGKSSYQIVVDSMQPAGAGALMALLEKRRKELEKEGLFAPERKKKLPFLPQVIGVITSPTGAVIRDILHRISERFPLHVLVYPVAVQGEGAAEQIANAIIFFNSLPSSPSPLAGEGWGEGYEQNYTLHPNLPPQGGKEYFGQGKIPKPDLLIVARGGGSIEDLWAFNEEIVVRTAANSRIPLISAVGHETDTTLIDYASDQRAPTPTAAAEMAVPVREELRLALAQLAVRHDTAIFRLLSQRADQLQGLARGLPKPVQLLQTASQRLVDWGERLIAALPTLLVRKEQQLAVLAALLRPKVLQGEIDRSQERLLELQERLKVAVTRIIDARKEKLINITSLMESMDYRKILARGFTLVKDKDGKLITTASEARINEFLTVVFSDGEIPVKNI